GRGGGSRPIAPCRRTPQCLLRVRAMGKSPSSQAPGRHGCAPHDSSADRLTIPPPSAFREANLRFSLEKQATKALNNYAESRSHRGTLMSGRRLPRWRQLQRKRSRAEGDKSTATPQPEPRWVALRVLADTPVDVTNGTKHPDGVSNHFFRVPRLCQPWETVPHG